MEKIASYFVVALVCLSAISVQAQSPYFENGKGGCSVSYALGFGSDIQVHTGSINLVMNGRIDLDGSFSLINSANKIEEPYSGRIFTPDRSWGLAFGWNIFKHSPGFPIGLYFQTNYLKIHYSLEDESNSSGNNESSNSLSVGIEPYWVIPFINGDNIYLTTGVHHIMYSTVGSGGGVEEGIPIKVNYVFKRGEVPKVTIGGEVTIYLQSESPTASLGISYTIPGKKDK